MTEERSSLFFYERVASRLCGTGVKWDLNCSSLHMSASEVNRVNLEIGGSLIICA